MIRTKSSNTCYREIKLSNKTIADNKLKISLSM